jgi:hypothetical protein
MYHSEMTEVPAKRPVTLADARNHIEAMVTYTSPGGERREHGVIDHVNDTFVFVRYQNDRMTEGRPVATDPERLEYR